MTELRKQLQALLEGGQAHASPERILSGADPRKCGQRPGPALHSPWQLLEHLRISQEDILRYTFDPDWKSPEWPEGYWPTAPAPGGQKAWDESAGRFLADLAEIVQHARDPRLDLLAELPHGGGRTYLRQFLLAADHNAYHLGQLVLARKFLGDWE
jgi:hypothetical protein